MTHVPRKVRTRSANAPSNKVCLGSVCCHLSPGKLGTQLGRPSSAMIECPGEPLHVHCSPWRRSRQHQVANLKKAITFGALIAAICKTKISPGQLVFHRNRTGLPHRGSTRGCRSLWIGGRSTYSFQLLDTEKCGPLVSAARKLRHRTKSTNEHAEVLQSVLGDDRVRSTAPQPSKLDFNSCLPNTAHYNRVNFLI
jgi:hypothetical protein